MPIYDNAQQLYACVGDLFDEVQRSHPGASDAIGRAGMNYRLRTVKPAGTILIAGRRKPPAVHFDPAGSQVDIDIQLSADTLHQILLGDLSVTKALGQRRLVVKGPVFKALSLTDLFRHGRTIYPQVLRAHGIR